MIKNEKNNFNGKYYKSNQSISSTLGIDSTEEKNNTKIILTHHRKTISSFFLNSYMADNDINKLLKETTDKTINETKKFNDFSYENENNSYLSKNKNIYELKNSLLKEKNLNSSNTNTNLNTNENEKYIAFSNSSFYSYTNENEENPDEINQNTTIKITQPLTNDFKADPKAFIYSNNSYKEADNNYSNNINEKYNKERSFVPMKNTLKYIKDKDERVTDSYLMALNSGKIGDKNEKTQYLPTVSVIEEEKSENIETTSKKQNIINGSIILLEKDFKKKTFENNYDLIKNISKIIENNIKNNDKENKRTNVLNNNYFIVEEKPSKINLDLNKIIIKNTYREENKNNKIYKNIFNKKNSKLHLNGKSANKQVISTKNNTKNKRIIKTSRTNKIYSPPAIFVNKKIKTITYGEDKNNPSFYHQRFNTDNLFKKKIQQEKYNISTLIDKRKIGNNLIYKINDKSIENIKLKKDKIILNKSLNNLHKSKIIIKSKIPYNKLVINKKNESNLFNQKLKINLKINNINHHNDKNKISLNLNHKKSISILNTSNKNNYNHKNTLSDIDITEKRINSSKMHKKIKRVINQNIKINNNTEKAISKNKNKKIVSNNFSQYNLPIYNISNLKQTAFILKEKIKFSTINEKFEVLKAILKYNNNTIKNKFIILCENKGKIIPIFIFKGLYKFNDDDKIFTKIYGNIKCPEYIMMNNLNNTNYIIYENKIISNDGKNFRILMNKINNFSFSFNSIIICKR